MQYITQLQPSSRIHLPIGKEPQATGLAYIYLFFWSDPPSKKVPKNFPMYPWTSL